MGYWTKAASRRPRKRSDGRWCGGALLLALSTTAAGCDDIPSITRFEPIEDPAQLFMSLTLDHRAINLSTAAPYDTFRLSATAWNGRGEPMNGLPEPTFRSTDTTRVWVTPDGLLRARGAASQVEVIAEILSHDNVRKADTAVVNVTTVPNPPVLTTFSINPATPEGRVWGMLPAHGAAPFGAGLLLVAGINLVQPSLPRVALDADGNPIPGLQIHYRSLDLDVADITPRTGQVTGSLAALGTARFVATTVAFGVAHADTATITMELPRIHGPMIARGYDGKPVLYPTEVTIQQGGYGFWRNQSGVPVEVKFRDPTHVAELSELCMIFGQGFCGAGDIPLFDGSSVSAFEILRGRRFPVPGIYEYEIPQTGLSGRVIVVAEGAAP